MLYFLRLTVLFLAVLSCIAFHANANSQKQIEKESLRFVVNHPGSKPYLYKNNKNDTYQGVIPDILKGIDDQRLNIRFISNGRERSEKFMYEGTADLIMLSSAWLKHPEKLIHTIPIHQHKSYFYSLLPFESKFSIEKLKTQIRLCTRRGYAYPTLSKKIAEKNILRVDSSNHVTMVKMLFKRRCDYTVMNEFNALSLFKIPELSKQETFRSPQPISAVPLHIILRPQLTTVKRILDEHIKKLKDSGELDKIIEFHTLKID